MTNNVALRWGTMLLTSTVRQYIWRQIKSDKASVLRCSLCSLDTWPPPCITIGMSSIPQLAGIVPMVKDIMQIHSGNGLACGWLHLELHTTWWHSRHFLISRSHDIVYHTLHQFELLSDHYVLFEDDPLSIEQANIGDVCHNLSCWNTVIESVPTAVCCQL